MCRAAVGMNLAGDDDGSLIVAVFDDFEEIALLLGRQGFQPPIVPDKRSARATDGAKYPRPEGRGFTACSGKGRDILPCVIVCGNILQTRTVSLAVAKRSRQERIFSIRYPC